MNRPETLSTRSSWLPISTTAGSCHAEHREQLPREEEEERSDERGNGEPDARRDVHRLAGAIGFAGAEVLARDRRGGAHEPDRRPRDQREELRSSDTANAACAAALCASEPMNESMNTPPTFIAIP